MEDLQSNLPHSVDPPSLLKGEINAGDSVAPELSKLDITGAVNSIGSGDSLGLNEEAVKGDFFPFLSLPKDIRRLIFKSYLSVEDKLRARVNNELWELEAEGSNKMRKLSIVDDPEFEENCCCCKVDKRKRQQHKAVVLTMKLTKSVETYEKGLEKITSNSTFQSILFKINQPVYGDLLRTVAEIPAPTLMIEIEDDALRGELFTVERVEELARGRKTLVFFKPIPSLTSELFIQLFERMESGDDPLREITFHEVPAPIIRSALSTLGVHLCEQGHLHVADRSTKVYLWNTEYFILFDDRVFVIGAPIFIENEPGYVSLERYEVDGTNGGCIFTKEQMEEYLSLVPMLYPDEEDEEDVD